MRMQLAWRCDLTHYDNKQPCLLSFDIFILHAGRMEFIRFSIIHLNVLNYNNYIICTHEDYLTTTTTPQLSMYICACLIPKLLIEFQK